MKRLFLLNLLNNEINLSFNKIIYAMGKGDMKTRRGKIFRGTYGKLRPRNKAVSNPVGVKPQKKKGK